MRSDLRGRAAVSAKGEGNRSRAGARPQGRLRRVDAEHHSLAAILNLARLGEASTRNEIEKKSGLGRAVVADRLATLADLGLIEEGELGVATGGRAPRLVRFRADAGLVLTAVLDQSTIGVGVADLSGRLLVEHHEAADLGAGAEPTLKRLGTLFDWVLEQHRDNREVWGIGIAVPGPVESSDGHSLAFPTLRFMPNWDDYPAVEHLMLQHRAPVFVRSSVQMMTLGELRAGSGAGALDLLFVELGKEINAGLISDGHLHRGAEGAAGLLGHVSTGDDSTAVCRCGNTGCLEVVAGGDAIAREALQAARDGRSRYLAEALAANGAVAAVDVGLAAQLGDSFSAELLSRCGRLIGTALAALTNVLNPALIVLGGSVAQTGDILLAAIREAVYRRSHPLVTRDLGILRSQMGSSGGLVGSALAAVDEIFSPKSLGTWIGFGSPLRHPDVASLVARAEQATHRSDQRPRPPASNAMRSGSSK